MCFACVGTAFEWVTEYTLEELNLNTHIVKLAGAAVLAAGLGTSILFGWGFDSNPQRIL